MHTHTHTHVYTHKHVRTHTVLTDIFYFINFLEFFYLTFGLYIDLYLFYKGFINT